MPRLGKAFHCGTSWIVFNCCWPLELVTCGDTVFLKYPRDHCRAVVKMPTIRLSGRGLLAAATSNSTRTVVRGRAFPPPERLPNSPCRCLRTLLRRCSKSRARTLHPARPGDIRPEVWG